METILTKLNNWIKLIVPFASPITVSLTAIIAGYFLFKGFTHQGKTGVEFAAAKYKSAFCCHLEGCNTSDSCEGNTFDASAGNRKAIIDSFFASRLSDYLQDQEKLSDFLSTLSILMMFGLLLLYYNPAEVNLPFLSTPLPHNLVCLVIVGGLIYYWVNFALLMMAAIDSRMVLEFAIDSMEASFKTPINHYYSQSRILLDQGFIDPWCTYYYDIFKSGFDHGKHLKNSRFFLFFIYVPFLGSVVGTSIAVALNLFKRKPNILSLSIVVTACATISATSNGMLNWYKHAAFFYAGIWAFAAVLFCSGPLGIASVAHFFDR